MQRPPGITVLAVFYLSAAGILGLTSIVLIFGRSFLSGVSGPVDSGPPPSARGLALMGLLCLLLALLNVICAIGFMKLKKWSRALAIIFHFAWAIFWALSILGLRLHPSFPSLIFRIVLLAIQAWVVVYLLAPKVGQAFTTNSA
jgi:hypothetical protein